MPYLERRTLGNINFSLEIETQLDNLGVSSGGGGSGETSGSEVSAPEEAAMWFDGDTLLTDASLYLSGSGSNLYFQGTNTSGQIAKFEMAVVNGFLSYREVEETYFGVTVDDNYFRFDGETLLTQADIYITGSDNHLYFHGTDEAGEDKVFYLNIENGVVYLVESGSV